MTNLTNELEAEEVGEDLRDVVDNGSNTKQSGRSSIILKRHRRKGKVYKML